MRILHLADRLSARGGADLHLLGILEGQARRHDVSLVVGHDDGSARSPCPVTVLPALAARARAPVELGRLVDAARPDVIHLHNVMNPVALAQAAALGALVTVQDHRFFCPGRGKWTADRQACRASMGRETCASCFDDVAYFDSILGLTCERLEALKQARAIVLSHYMRRELIAAGVEAARVHVVPPFVHGLDPEAAPSAPRCVLFAGRLVEAKGVWDAVTAWRVSGLALPLVFAGTGPLRAELEAQGLSVLGWIAHERMAGLYRSARALLMPPRWQEPFGIAGLEALTLGTPVVAWDSGGIAEWHPGPGLVEWGDVAALGAALHDAPGREARAPFGFDRESLMLRLEQVYASESPFL